MLMSFPTGTEMFQFPAFALLTLCIQAKSTCFNLRLVSLFVLTRVKTPAPLTLRASPARGLVVAVVQPVGRRLQPAPLRCRRDA